MSTNNPKEIGQALTSIRKGERERELFMNPATGELEVRSPGEHGAHVDKDALPATRMAREGFF